LKLSPKLIVPDIYESAADCLTLLDRMCANCSTGIDSDKHNYCDLFLKLRDIRDKIISIAMPVD
jgi:ribosomal protein S27AE